MFCAMTYVFFHHRFPYREIYEDIGSGHLLNRTTATILKALAKLFNELFRSEKWMKKKSEKQQQQQINGKRRRNRDRGSLKAVLKESVTVWCTCCVLISTGVMDMLRVLIVIRIIYRVMMILVVVVIGFIDCFASIIVWMSMSIPRLMRWFTIEWSWWLLMMCIIWPMICGHSHGMWMMCYRFMSTVRLMIPWIGRTNITTVD